jgi:hypothetical protein
MNSARYVYAIVRRDASLPTTVSVGAATELAMVPCGELAAVTRRMAAEEPRLTMDAVLHHELVVEAVREQVPALPVRFGTVFRNARSLASALAERYEPLAADLHRLGDKAELSLTALWSAPTLGAGPVDAPRKETAVVGDRAGANYLRARAAELRRDEALEERARSFAQKLDEALGAFAIERRVTLVPTPRVAIRTAYLIDPARADAFRMAFDAMRLDLRELRMLLTGPWPPYSFAAPSGSEGLAATHQRVTSVAQLLTDAMQERRG